MDFAKERSPQQYDNSFDLVLDKIHWIVLFAVMLVPLHSYCVRCIEVYGLTMASTLSFPFTNWISYYLLPLLRDSSGAEWIVEHTTMQRKVEQLKVSKHNSCISTTKPADSVYNNSAAVSSTSSSSSPCSLLHKKPLNVFLARRYRKDCDVKDSINHDLNFDDVYEHVHKVNDEWFQQQQPLLTEERMHALRLAFETATLNEHT
jgi:hypothetical protein